jgi:hypothetical protein
MVSNHLFLLAKLFLAHIWPLAAEDNPGQAVALDFPLLRLPCPHPLGCIWSKRAATPKGF